MWINLNIIYNKYIFLCAELSLCHRDTALLEHSDAATFWPSTLTPNWSRVAPTHVPLEASYSNPTGGGGSRQTHEMAAAYVTRKQRRSDLQRETGFMMFLQHMKQKIN